MDERENSLERSDSGCSIGSGDTRTDFTLSFGNNQFIAEICK